MNTNVRSISAKETSSRYNLKNGGVHSALAVTEVHIF